MTLAPTLDTERLTRFRRKVTALSSCGLFLDGFDLTVIAVALPVLEDRWHLSGATLGLVSSSALIGMFVGAIGLGWLTDRIGRRTVYGIDLLFFVLFALLTAVAQDAVQLIVFRFLLGLAIGADYPISSSLTTEFAATRTRGRHLAFMSMCYSAGAAVAYLMGAAFSGTGPDSWRWMLLVGAVIALVVAIARKAIPESPRWLRSQGRGAEARDVLDDLLGEKTSAPVTTEKAKAEGLLSPRLRRATLFVCLFYFCFNIVFYGIQLYTPTIVAGTTGSSDAAAAVGSAGVSVLGVLGMLVGSVIIDAWGRRPSVLLGLAGQAVLLAILALLIHPPFAAVVIMFALGLFFANLGPGIMILLYPSELFPTALRGRGVGLSVAVSRVGAVLGVFVFPNLIDAWGFQHALWLFVTVGAIAVLLSVFLAPETKGRVLEETSGETAGEPRPG